MNRKNLIPLACTLIPEQLRANRGDLLPGRIERGDEVGELENRVRLPFAPRPDIIVELARVVEQEAACCQFLSSHLEAAPQSKVVLEVT